jgi:hypothetical protein
VMAVAKRGIHLYVNARRKLIVDVTHDLRVQSLNLLTAPQ